MYGGDEVSAIVLDIGSTNAKAGYAGEDTPKCVIPSSLGAIYVTENNVAKNVQYFVGTSSLSFRRDKMEIINPIQKGLVSNWEAMEQLWDHIFLDRLRINPKEHPLLVSEPSFNTRPFRETLTEILFEKHEIPGLFVAKNAVLTCFASGKSSGLVLDSGGGTTCVAAVHDGYVLQRSIIKSLLGGDALTDIYLKTLEQKNIHIRPHYMIQSKREIRPGEFEVQLKDLPNTTESYRQYMIKQIIRDLKESVCRISDSTFDEQSNANIPSIGYELPDGNVISVGTDRFSIPELLFNPEPLNEKGFIEEPLVGLPQMVWNSISKCDTDIRRELFSSIVVTGGNSLLPQFSERLHNELLEKVPQMYKVRMVATNSTVERQFSVWIGGSILASLGTFQQMWMSKSEYDEHGRSLVERKCP